MKERVSASVEKETVDKINVLLDKKKFRNKSHIIEAAIELLEKSEDSNGK